MYQPELALVENLRPTISAWVGMRLVVSRSKDIKLTFDNSINNSSNASSFKIVL